MSRKKYEEKMWILDLELRRNEITLAEYNERTDELYRYWLAYGVDDE